MRNIGRLFCDDVKRLTSNVVTGIIVLGLVFMPSLFSWYNIVACWDVFGNTGNLKVAVANTDEGYESDLMPLRVNIGEQVVSALRANDQLNWTFVSEDEAIDGAQSGKYYAAVVIPPSFSKDMMTFYSDDVEHAQIVYYTNEKKSAVAPKVTDQGAGGVSSQVNEVFAETLSEVALGISSAISRYANDADASGRIGDLAHHIDTMGTQMSQAASVLTLYSSVMGSAQVLVDGSSKLLTQTREAAGQVGSAAGEGRQALNTISDAMSASSDALSYALQQSSAGYAGLSDSIDAAFKATGSLTASSAQQLREQATAIDVQIAQYRSIVEQLEQLKNRIDDSNKPAVEMLIKRLNASIEQQEKLRDGLIGAAASIEAGNADAQGQHAEVKRLVTDAQASISGLAASYDTDIRPGLDQLTAEVSAVASSLERSASKLDAAGATLQGSAGSVSGQLGDAKGKLDSVATDLIASSEKFASLSQSITQALSSGDLDTLRAVLNSDPAVLAATLAAPVQLERHPVYPAENFGSQMAPLYTTLALWIGSLLLLVAVRVAVSEKAQQRLNNPKLYQLFLGRFGIFAVLSLLQTTCMALGNMLFLKVQVSDPFLYLVCFWLAGLVFTFVIYSLVVSFANLGKAIAVLLLIVQVTSAGGSYPLQLLPEFFQVLSPYLPATHVINAMRAAMMGAYQNEFWIQMGELLLFLLPAAFIGLVMRKPLMKFLDWFVEKVEDSKLVA
ncbi:MAG: YhgE/Pip domain-containing protein [Gordonibacter sp.]|nr:YhgE/Pip domain-containing protein [Gordonibacter sp.]